MKEILYRSTRSDADSVKSSEALLRGLAPDGGLYVPCELPEVTLSEIQGFSKMEYKDVAYEILSRLLSDFTAEELKACVNAAYDEKFDTSEIAPVVKKDGMYFLELFHGPTIAFKDMALSILPHLLTTASRKNGNTNEIVILTATSGDTGKAALAAFADVPGTKIIVFYPKYGVSPVQEKQMVTQRGANTRVIGITGNFDDAQTGVKEMFSDKELEKVLGGRGYQFSSANSINIGRLMPQVAYYFWTYSRLVKDGVIKMGDPINFTVPTGNFGDILACYYAKKMGLPVKKMVCASNENKVLFDFFNTGVYDRRRDFKVTSSPSMDILISSNLERLIFDTVGGSAERCEELMKDLKEKGVYELSEKEREGLSDFAAGFASEEETAAEIALMYKNAGYVLDTHTAVASWVGRYYKFQSEDMGCGATADAPMAIVATASPFKFSRSVMGAIDKNIDGEDFALIDKLAEMTALKVPQAIEDIRSAPVLHDIVCDKEEMQEKVLEFLK